MLLLYRHRNILNTDTGSTNTCPNTSSYPWTNFNSITFIRIITRNSPTLPQNKYKTNNTYNLQHKNNVLNICTCPRHPGFVACWQLTTFVYNTLKRTTITNDFYSPTLQCPSTYPRRPLSTWLSSFTVQDPGGGGLRDLEGAVSFHGVKYWQYLDRQREFHSRGWLHKFRTLLRIVQHKAWIAQLPVQDKISESKMLKCACNKTPIENQTNRYQHCPTEVSKTN